MHAQQCDELNHHLKLKLKNDTKNSIFGLKESINAGINFVDLSQSRDNFRIMLQHN